MALAKNGSKFNNSVTAMINEKMKVLEDFGICSRCEKSLEKPLKINPKKTLENISIIFADH